MYETRCFGGPDHPLMMRYHDEEWGVPVHDDRLLFELLCLEGAQAGLSWQTILNKRESYRQLSTTLTPEKSPHTQTHTRSASLPMKESYVIDLKLTPS